MEQTTICGDCGSELTPGTSICANCGWDLTTSVVRPPQRSLLHMLAAGGWRVVVLALLLSLPVLGFIRLRHTGPGPDLATTLRWMVLGDGGRAAELVTIHRMFEIGSAASRFAVREMEPPPFDGDWATMLAPKATMMVRGWIPMLFIGATTDMAPQSVREIYSVRAVDGWGRPFRVSTRLLPRGSDWEGDPQVAADLAEGLHKNLLEMGRPDFSSADHLRLLIESAGNDGDLDTADDVRMISYVPVGFTVQLSRDREKLQQQLDRAYDVGRHYFRFEGTDVDLIDARMLAEFRLETVS